VVVKKRTKRYRPKPVMHDNMAFVMSGMARFTSLKTEALSIMLQHRIALEALRTGRATRADIDKLISIVNIAEALAEHGRGAEYLPDIHAAQAQLKALAARGAARGMRFTMNAEQWAALKHILDIHEAQLEAATVYDIEQSYDLVMKRLRHQQVDLIPTPKGESRDKIPH
jgi:hypothetical protein